MVPGHLSAHFFGKNIEGQIRTTGLKWTQQLFPLLSPGTALPLGRVRRVPQAADEEEPNQDRAVGATQLALLLPPRLA